MNNAKMAKSAGGFVTLADLPAKGYSPLDYRYHCFTAHYRKQLDFTWESLDGSKTSRRRLAEAARALPAASGDFAEHAARFKDALSDDLNMPAALAVVWDALKSDLPGGAKRGFLELADSVLALDLFKAEEIEAVPAEIVALLADRAAARVAKDFPKSDVIRKRIEELGYLVKDGKDGAKAVKK